MDFLEGQDIEIHNGGNELTFINSIRQEVINLTFASSDVVQLIKKWHVYSLLFRNPRKTDFTLQDKMAEWEER